MALRILLVDNRCCCALAALLVFDASALIDSIFMHELCNFFLLSSNDLQSISIVGCFIRKAVFVSRFVREMSVNCLMLSGICVRSQLSSNIITVSVNGHVVVVTQTRLHVLG